MDENVYTKTNLTTKTTECTGYGLITHPKYWRYKDLKWIGCSDSIYKWIFIQKLILI